MLCIILSVTQVSAGVNDNVLTSKLESVVGAYEDSTEAHTIFGLLQKIYKEITSLRSDLAEVKTSVANIELDTDSLRATAGGGIYVSCYSKKAYLDKYRLRITDGTVTKTTTIAYNSDSNYYEGSLTAPFTQGNLTITILEYGSDDDQGSIATSINKANSYATINLDPLIDANYAYFLDVNDALATNLYKDPLITATDDRRSTFVEKLALYDGHLSDFMKSSYGVGIESKSFAELYENHDEFLACIDGSVGKYLLENATVGRHIANTRQLLRWIIDDNIAIAVCEGNNTFCEYLQATTLPTITQTKPAGEENILDGNLLCLNIVSGCRGNDWSGDECIGQDNMGYYRYLRNKGVSVCGTTKVGINGTDKVLFNAQSIAGWQVYWRNYYSNGYTGSYVNRNTCNQTARCKFLDKVEILAYDSVTFNLGRHDEWSLVYEMGSMSTSILAQNSVITYIDLDAE